MREFVYVYVCEYVWLDKKFLINIYKSWTCFPRKILDKFPAQDLDHDPGQDAIQVSAG